MQVSRDRFISQFAISIMVRALKTWPRSTKRFPEHMPTAIYETIKGTNGQVSITSREFGVIVDPVLREIHQLTPFRTRPDHNVLTGLVYDALDAAGVEVTIGPPLAAWGHMYGAKR